MQIKTNEKIAEYLKLGNGFVPFEADPRFGFIRLSAFNRVSIIDLHESPYQVVVLVTTKVIYLLLVRLADGLVVNCRALSATYDTTAMVERSLIAMVKKGEDRMVANWEHFPKTVKEIFADFFEKIRRGKPES